MYQKQMYDITEVCRMLGTTSRTLRFYEEKGIIQSTTVGISSRRQYTEEQVSLIKNVLVLRTLGLSVKAIAELQNSGTDLKEAVLSKRAEIYASIDSRLRKISLLNEALCALNAGKDIFDGDWQIRSDAKSEELEIAQTCTNAILNNDNHFLYRYFSSKLEEYMPKDAYQIIRKDVLAPLGEFISVEQICVDKKYPNKVYSKIRYAKLGLIITFVFHSGMIDGLWFGYYDIAER